MFGGEKRLVLHIGVTAWYRFIPPRTFSWISLALF